MSKAVTQSLVWYRPVAAHWPKLRLTRYLVFVCATHLSNMHEYLVFVCVPYLSNMHEYILVRRNLSYISARRNLGQWACTRAYWGAKSIIIPSNFGSNQVQFQDFFLGQMNSTFKQFRDKLPLIPSNLGTINGNFVQPQNIWMNLGLGWVVWVLGSVRIGLFG